MKTEMERWKAALAACEDARREAGLRHQEAEKASPKPFEIKNVIRVTVTGPDSVNIYVVGTKDGRENVRDYTTLRVADMLNLGAYIKAVFGEKEVCPSE